MINFIVVGKNKEVVTAVLRAIRSFTDAKSIVIGGRETAGLCWSNLCERHFAIRFDGRGDEYFVEMIGHYADKMPHVVLIPADSEAIRMLNRVRDRISVSITASPDTSTADTFANPIRFRQLCRRHQLPVLPTVTVNSGDECEFGALAAELGLPFNITLTHSLLSGHEYLIHDKRDFENALGGRKRAASFVAQRHVDGIDVEIGLLADRGQVSALAIQRTVGPHIAFEQNSALQKMAVVLCRLTAYNGVMHLKARVESQTGKVYLVESAPHFWPGLTASVWCGLNFVAESVRQTPRSKGLRKLESGTFALRHPIIRPASWSSLVGDAGERGRLLRSMTFDTYSLGCFVRNMPRTMLRYAARGMMAQRRMQNQITASLAVDPQAEQSQVYISSSQA